MKSVIIDHVSGSELPREWARLAGVGPDEVVEVAIQAPREIRLKRLFELMDAAGTEAETKGLTDEKLAELLKDA